MRVYFGAGIQGAPTPEVRAERAALYRAMIEHIQSLGHDVLFEHTATNNKEEVWKVLEKQFGPLPPAGPERSNFIRNRNIEAIEHMADAAIFEVSMPSLGVGIELAHAYLRPKMGLKPIPILCLYQKGFWGHGLSIMVSGAASNGVVVKGYTSNSTASEAINSFFANLDGAKKSKVVRVKGTVPTLQKKVASLTLDDFCKKRIPDRVRDKIKLTYDFRGNSVTLVEERPHYQDPSHWTRSEIAQFRFDEVTHKWSLFCRDRNSKWHHYDRIKPTSNFKSIIAEVDQDPTGIFWG